MLACLSIFVWSRFFQPNENFENEKITNISTCTHTLKRTCLSLQYSSLLHQFGDKSSGINLHLGSASLILSCEFLNSVGCEVSSLAFLEHVV